MNATNCSPQMESILDINITQIGIDECVTADCTHSSGCISKREQNHVPTITTAGSVSLVSVTVLSHAVCGCAARENPHLSCSSYQTNPCLNGGTCVDTDFGYRLVKHHVVCKQNACSASGTIIACLLTVADLSFVILHTQVLQKNLYFRYIYSTLNIVSRKTLGIFQAAPVPLMPPCKMLLVCAACLKSFNAVKHLNHISLVT